MAGIGIPVLIVTFTTVYFVQYTKLKVQKNVKNSKVYISNMFALNFVQTAFLSLLTFFACGQCKKLMHLSPF